MTHSLGNVDLPRGNPTLALDRYREAHPLLLRSASSFDLAYMIGAVAAVAAQGGRREVAGRLWGAFDRLHNESERMLEPETHALLERNVGALDPADVEAGRALSEDEAVALAQRTADDLAASLRSRLARTSGHSSSRTE
jgi:hypothetical protein